MKIAQFNVGWNGAIALSERADATEQAPEESPTAEQTYALTLASEIGGRLEATMAWLAAAGPSATI
jgi:hypothetical protein